VRAGSIVPFGPEQQWVGEKPADPVTLFVYAGADGTFSLYEDDGLSYAYERGGFSRIPITWDDASGKLTLGAREGSFPSMIAARDFQVVLVASDHPVGFTFDPVPVATVHYTGAAATVTVRRI
jgi:alpha-D-xyloside xylohydrolase